MLFRSQNAINAGKSLSVPLPLTAQILEILKSLNAQGFGEEDHSAVLKFFEKISVVEVKD